MNGQPVDALPTSSDGRIAIIGMSGRFPGAPDLETYWHNLAGGTESIRPLTPQDVMAWDQDPAVLDDPSYVTRYGTLDGYTEFDAALFGYPPREAELIDPQQRIFLESVWEALEHAGYDPSAYSGQIGVYAGCRNNFYSSIVRSQRSLFPQIDEYQLAIGTSVDFLTSRVAYKLGLTGPAQTILTTCSTSLVAIHQACQSLIGGECDIAISGGVSVRIPRIATPYREGGVVAPDGHCRAFDAQARGTVVGDGVGVVVLKRLAEAMADGDSIYAVILGTAVNNDGAARVGFTAPSVEGQAAVIRAAHGIAEVDPDSISYVEAHGTGTVVGDPIEVAGLTRAFRDGTDRNGFCALGSVKSNIGHTDAAAGVAGLLKVVLALNNAQLPPSLHFTEPNPEIDFAQTPFYVNTELGKWEATNGPRRAGVSSFGMGGTNAHTVVEEPPTPPPTGAAPPLNLLTLSARTPSALSRVTANLAEHLREHPEPPIADVAYTLQVGRQAMAHRRFVVCADRQEAIRALAGDGSGAVTGSVEHARSSSVSFMFPGQGTQRPGMAHDLYQMFGGFRRIVDELCAAAAEPVGCDLRELMFQGSGTDMAEERLRRTEFAQPALFVVEYALARLLMDLGITPSSLIGHSLGEYVAACLAGVFDAADAVRLVAQRGKLVQRVPGGLMVAVPLGEQDLGAFLVPGAEIAAVNGPDQCAISGSRNAVLEVESRLAQAGIAARRLVTSHPFHSQLLDPILDEFAGHVAAVRRSRPSIPFVSNVTGTFADPDEVLDASYWVRQLRHPVRFYEGLDTVLQEPNGVLVEVGPGRVLSTLARRHPGAPPAHRVIAALGRRSNDRCEVETVLSAVGNLWLNGIPVSWANLHEHHRRRVPLPTYPFERQEYVIYPRRTSTAPAAAAAAAAAPTAPTVHTTAYAPTDLASSVALIFEEVLGISMVKGGDDFFDLGGDSLSASQLLARIREVFLVSPPLTTIFETPTVDGLADLLAELMARDPRSTTDDDIQEDIRELDK